MHVRTPCWWLVRVASSVLIAVLASPAAAQEPGIAGPDHTLAPFASIVTTAPVLATPDAPAGPAVPPSLMRVSTGSLLGGTAVAIPAAAIMTLSGAAEMGFILPILAGGIVAYPFGAAVGGHRAARTTAGETSGARALAASLLGSAAGGAVAYVLFNAHDATPGMAVVAVPAAMAVHAVVTGQIIRDGWTPYDGAEWARPTPATQPTRTRPFATAGLVSDPFGTGPTIVFGARRGRLELSGQYMHIRGRRVFPGPATRHQAALLLGYRLGESVSVTGAVGIGGMTMNERIYVWDPALANPRTVERSDAVVVVPVDVGLAIPASARLRVEMHGALDMHHALGPRGAPGQSFLAWIGASIRP